MQSGSAPLQIRPKCPWGVMGKRGPPFQMVKVESEAQGASDVS